MLFTDWNKSGAPSLRVSNDRQYYRGGEEQMWRIEPGKTPRLYSRADGWRHLSIYGMGIAEGDLDGSGYPQYFLTSMGDEKLQKLDAEEAGRGEAPIYRDIAGEVGATAHIPYTGGDKRPSTAWHAEFADFNNAGLLDIFVSKGNLEQMPDFAAYDPSNLLIGQWNGKFAEAGDEAGIACNAKGRGALIADFNLDGMLDILQINRGSNVMLFRNLGAKNGDGPPLPMGNWSEIKLIEPNPNRNAVGARISVRTGTRTQTRFVDVGGGDASGHAGFDSCRPRHSRAGGNKGAMAGRRIERQLSRLRQPVRGHRPHEASGGLLVSGALNAVLRDVQNTIHYAYNWAGARSRRRAGAAARVFAFLGNALIPWKCLENAWKILGKVWIRLGFSLELTLISLSESSLFKGLRRPSRPFFLSAPILPFRPRRAPTPPSLDQNMATSLTAPPPGGLF